VEEQLLQVGRRLLLSLMVGCIAFGFSFSPDGQQIAFVSSRSGQADIWALKLESGETWNVTNSPGGDFRPAWSPDGKWICWRRSAEGATE
jgi:Tol biopolymer transport system component